MVWVYIGLGIIGCGLFLSALLIPPQRGEDHILDEWPP